MVSSVDGLALVILALHKEQLGVARWDDLEGDAWWSLLREGTPTSTEAREAIAINGDALSTDRINCFSGCVAREKRKMRSIGIPILAER